MNQPLFELSPNLSLPVTGGSSVYPVGRIFCVGRNYAAHAAEMGFEVDRAAPFYFTKSGMNALPSGAALPYPPCTQDFHHEMELAVAIGAPVFSADKQAARGAIFGYGCALDMTRRDLQISYRKQQRPWSLGKDFEGSAVLGAITPAAQLGEISAQRIRLTVNGDLRQDALLSDMIWKVDEIIADLSRFYHLRPGDLILTGTPSGVGPVSSGDSLRGEIDGLQYIALDIVDAI